MSVKAAFHTLGCRVNSYETDLMRKDLSARGYTEVPFEPGADVYIVNTCTVTNIADRKSRQMLHRAKEMNPDAVVVACGCYVEDAKESLLVDPAVDVLIANDQKEDLGDILAAVLKERGRDIPAADLTDGTRLSDAEHTRAFVKIQDGCNQFCTYCMIPYVRGRVKSRAEEDILKEIKAAAESGKKEIVLTGIHMSSYGMDLDEPGVHKKTPDVKHAVTNTRLLELVKKTAAVEGVERIRFGSLEPGIMTEEFVAGLAAIPEVCPAFHLSLQSGCDATLVRMGRRYEAEDYAGICALLRRYFDRPGIMTDIITGFPGETEEEFAASYAFAEKIRFSRMHIFPYSVRKGTKAASLPGQLPDKIKRERARRLIALDDNYRQAFAETFIGREVEVLAEEKDADGKYWKGYTKEYVPVLISSGEDLENVIVSGIPERADDGVLYLAEVALFGQQ